MRDKLGVRLAAVLAGFAVALKVHGSPVTTGKSAPDAAGVSDALREHHCDPQQTRLALGSTAREIRVSWTTASPGCDARVHFRRSGPNAAWGQGSNDSNNSTAVYGYEADATVFDSFEPKDFCGEPATKDNFDPPNLQSALLTKLEPGALYEYRIGHHGSYREFRAPPDTGPDAIFSFVTYGDMGESVHKSAKSPGAGITAARVAEEVIRGGSELVVHVGDISYADGRHKIWQAFLDTIEPYAARAPYQIAVGNHEYDYKRSKHHHSADPSGRKDPYQPDWGNYGNDSGGECGLTVSKLFLMPRSPTLHGAENRAHHSNPPFWFAYAYGSVHFVTISTEHDLTEGSPQHEWLKLDLAAVDRCLTPWVVLLSHRPMYVVHPHKSNRIVGEHIRKSLEPLLHDFGVDLVLSGHVHAYARTCAVHKEQCRKPGQGGAYHVTLGCGGRKLSSVTHTQPDWLEYARRQYGFGRVSVHGSESLVFEYVLSETGEVKDSFTLDGRRSHLQCPLQDIETSSFDGTVSLRLASGTRLASQAAD